MRATWYSILQSGLTTLFCLALFSSAQAQAPDSLRLHATFPVRAAFATGDQFSNVYVITDDNAVVKFDSSGKQTALFTNNRLGRAAAVDAANPLKVLVWYPDFQTLLTLDRTLNEMGRLNFAAAGLYAVRCAAMSADGNIWVYDELSSKAVKLGADGQLLLESQPLNRAIGLRFSASVIRDNGQTVALNDPGAGICFIDPFGALLRFDPLGKTPALEWDGDWLVSVRDSELLLQNRQYLAEHRFLLPPHPGAWWLSNGCFFVQRGDVLEKFVWK